MFRAGLLAFNAAEEPEKTETNLFQITVKPREPIDVQSFGSAGKRAESAFKFVSAEVVRFDDPRLFCQHETQMLLGQLNDSIDEAKKINHDGVLYIMVCVEGSPIRWTVTQTFELKNMQDLHILRPVWKKYLAYYMNVMPLHSG